MKLELKDLVKELYQVAHKWEHIGVLLDIEIEKLDAIKTAENNMAQSCLREMLKIWMKRISPPPSWEPIAEALDRVDEQPLAEHLRNIYQV